MTAWFIVVGLNYCLTKMTGYGWSELLNDLISYMAVLNC